MDFEKCLPYEFGFGCSADDPLAIDLTEPLELMRTLVDARRGGAQCHVRQPVLQSAHPAAGDLSADRRLFAAGRSARGRVPADRHRAAVQSRRCPMCRWWARATRILQDYLPNVAQATVREGWTDFVGLGRMVLAYPELPADTLAGRTLERKRVCRTFSDCTTAPRNGLISGCYPLDPYYKRLARARAAGRKSSSAGSRKSF